MNVGMANLLWKRGALMVLRKVDRKGRYKNGREDYFLMLRAANIKAII